MDGAEVNSVAVSFLKELRTQSRESACCRLLGVSVASLENPHKNTGYKEILACRGKMSECKETEKRTPLDEQLKNNEWLVGAGIHKMH